MIALALIPAALGRAARSIPPRAWFALIALAGFLVLLAYCTTQARQDERAQAEQAHAEAYARALERDAAAKEAAFRDRVTDLQNNSDRQQELTNAVQNLPDARPSDRRRALACERLRQQGTDPADVPSCR